MATKSKTDTNRYPGTDTTPWVVKDSTGKAVTFPKDMKMKQNSFEVYSHADGAARTYTKKTGRFAQPVRL